MRIPGTTFSDSYDRLLEMNKQIADEIEEHLLEWSRDVVNTLSKAYKGASFKVVITMQPNALEIKNVGEVKIDVWQIQDTPPEHDLQMPAEFRVPFKPYVKIMSGNHSTVADCVKAVNERMDSIVHRLDNPEIIEMNGKKYKLVEVKE